SPPCHRAHGPSPLPSIPRVRRPHPSRRTNAMTETLTSPRLQGRLEWCDSRPIHIQARFDKVAVHQNRLMLISLVAYSQDAKAIRAGLAAGLNIPMRLREITLTKDGETIAPNDVWPSGHGYRVDAHRLGFGMLHALFTCRQPGFLLD